MTKVVEHCGASKSPQLVVSENAEAGYDVYLLDDARVV